jgi:hypothetical protein
MNESRLELTGEEMRSLGYRIVDQIVEHLETLASKPVMSVSPRAELEVELREPLPEGPAPVDSLLNCGASSGRTSATSNIRASSPSFQARAISSA